MTDDKEHRSATTEILVGTTSLDGYTLGKYRVLEPLGRGGMGRVYRAYHTHLERYVALKVLRADLVDDPRFLARFRREAQAVAALRHPHIVQVFDFDVEGDLYYMVLEMLEGETLKARLNDYRIRGEQMAPGEMARILLDVLGGLDYAHRQGVIHRDIKPANILLTKEGDAVIVDFGIAQMIGGTRHTSTGMLMGTLEYMAPEQGLKNQSDARSDLYSLGIVFYEMLTRQTPFAADTPLAVLMKHLNDPLPLPHQIAPGIPESFERIVLKAVAKEPEARYQEAKEMAEALRAAVEELEIVLPATLPQPFTFSTEEAPSDSVAVFSGKARERLAEEGFAADETDVTLGARLKGIARFRRGRTGEAIAGGLVLALVGNLLLLTLGGAAGSWGAFERGWPMELWLVGAICAFIMAQVESIWLLIPTILLMGNGLLMSYSALTGRWNQWAFLWIFEVWLVLGAIFFPIYLAKKPARARALSRSLGIPLTVAGAALTLIVAVLGMAVHLLSTLFK
ncbi:MAG: serine/threonine-protein kinase [Anaerolineales bacterium]